MMRFEYKGFIAEASFEEQKACYLGEVKNLTDLIRFRGLSPVQAQKAFQDCIDLYFAICQKRGIQPNLPVIAH